MIEDVLTAMKTLLSTKLDDELARQDGKYGDTIKLDSIKVVLIGNENVPELGLPAIVLRPEPSTYTQTLTTVKDAEHTILIGVVVTDTDEARSEKRLWRTMRAIENVMEIHATGYSGIENYTTTDQDYDVPVLESEGNSTEKGGQITAMILERLDAYVSTQL